MRTNVKSTLQFIAVILNVALLAGKLPSVADHDAAGFSIIGAIVGAGIVAIAFAIASFFSSSTEDFERTTSNLELWILRWATISFFIAMTGFTAFLYLHFEWLRIVLGVAVVSGVASVFSGLLTKLFPRQ